LEAQMIRTHRYDMDDPADAYRARMADAAPMLAHVLRGITEALRQKAKHDEREVTWSDVKDAVWVRIPPEAWDAMDDDSA
jgi:hypothetical protein